MLLIGCFKNPLLVISLISRLVLSARTATPLRVYISFHSFSALILSVFLDDKINYVFLESVFWRGLGKGEKNNSWSGLRCLPFLYTELQLLFRNHLVVYI